MKGMAMRRVLRRLDRIRTPKSTVPVIECDKEDIYAPPSTPLLAKRSRKQTSSEGDRAPPRTPLSTKRTRQQLNSNGICDSPLTDSSNILCPSNRTTLGCVSFGKRRKSLVTLVVGKDRQIFKVEPQMMEHRLLECLLARTNSADALLSSSSSGSSQDALWEEKENVVVHSKKGTAAERPIRLDCDAILFEHILWLLNNDDPAIRQLNIEELMEFYE
ncbi:hypothetical protein M758_9G124300 [Ceratodon purpureus]|uniref:Uncharacterized protein n=1 Tax=Ceratodon purpureus TaxID=3225 RepID=A0A8T0GV40_CERPU|nr:hypothetical protein KC19_9G109600 [Ceratodon purpureus]KAG0606237.1 hypothetical protein M758_9G124300 [Ceratodon purpureus]